MTAEFNPSSFPKHGSTNSNITALTVLAKGLIHPAQRHSQNPLETNPQKTPIIAASNLPPQDINGEMTSLLGLRHGASAHDSIYTPANVVANDESDHARRVRSRRDLRTISDQYGRYHYVSAQVEAQPHGQFAQWADGFYRYYYKGGLQGQARYIVGVDGLIYQLFEPSHTGTSHAHAHAQDRTAVQPTQAPASPTTSRNPILPNWGPNQSDGPPAGTVNPSKADYKNFGWDDPHPARPDQRLNHPTVRPGFQQPKPAYPASLGVNEQPAAPTRPAYVASASTRDPSKAFYGSHQSDQPDPGTRKPLQTYKHPGFTQPSSRIAGRPFTKPPAPLYHSRYDENGQPVDDSEDYTAVTDYYGRTIKTHVVGYDMNSKKIFSHLGPRKLIGILPNKTAVYGDYERVLIGWDENRRPVYKGDNFKQGTIDPQYLGRTASTPSYGKGFEFADTNWWEHNYTTTTRAPRIYISASRPSYLNKYDKYGHVLPDHENGRNRNPAFNRNSQAGAGSPQRQANFIARERPKARYPLYFFEDITCQDEGWELPTVKSKRQLGVSLMPPAAPPLPTGNKTIDGQHFAEYTAEMNIHRMQQKYFNRTLESEKPLMELLKEVEQEVLDAEQAQIENLQEKRESPEQAVFAKLPIAHFTSDTLESFLEEVLPRYQDAYGQPLTIGQAGSSFHNYVAEEIKTTVLGYFKNPTPEPRKQIIRLIKAFSALKTIFGNDASFMFTQSIQPGLMGENPRKISHSLHKSLADNLLSITYNPLFTMDAMRPLMPLSHAGGIIYKVETELYKIHVITNIYFDPKNPDILGKISADLETVAKSALADEMLAKRTPGFPLTRTTKLHYRPRLEKYHPVSINTLDEYNRIQILYDAPQETSVRDEAESLEILARMPFGPAAQEIKKIITPIKMILDVFFVPFAEEDSSGKPTGKIVRWTLESPSDFFSKYFIAPMGPLITGLNAISGSHSGEFHTFVDAAERYFSTIPAINSLCAALEDCDNRPLESIYHSKLAFHLAGIADQCESEFTRIRAYRIWLLFKYASSAADDAKSTISLAIARFMSEMANGDGMGEKVRIALKEINQQYLVNNPQMSQMAEQADAKLLELRNSVREIRLQDHIESKPQIADLLRRIGQMNFDSLVETDQIIKARQVTQQIGSAMVDIILTIASKGLLLPELIQNGVEILDDNTLGALNKIISGCVGEFDKMISPIAGSEKFLTTKAIEKVMVEIEQNFVKNDNALGKIARIFRGHLVSNLKLLFCVPGSQSISGLLSLIPQTIFSTINDFIFLDLIGHRLKEYQATTRQHVSDLQKKYYNGLLSKSRDELKSNFKWVYYSLCTIGKIEDPVFLKESQPLFFGENYLSLAQEYVASITGEAPLPEFNPLTDGKPLPIDPNIPAQDEAEQEDENDTVEKKRTFVNSADIVSPDAAKAAMGGKQIFNEKIVELSRIYGPKMNDIVDRMPKGIHFVDSDFVSVLGPLDLEVAQLKATFNRRLDGTGGYPAYDEFIRTFTITTTNAVGLPEKISLEMVMKSGSIEYAQEFADEQIRKNQQFMRFLAERSLMSANYCTIEDIQRSDGSRDQTVVRKTIEGDFRAFDIHVTYQEVHTESHGETEEIIGIIPTYTAVNPHDPHAVAFQNLMNGGQVLQEDRFKLITDVSDKIFYFKGQIESRLYELFYDYQLNFITAREAGGHLFLSEDNDFVKHIRTELTRKMAFSHLDTEPHVVPISTNFGKFKSFSKTPFIFSLPENAVSRTLFSDDVATLRKAFDAAHWFVREANGTPFVGLGIANVKLVRTDFVSMQVPHVESAVVGSSIGETTLTVNFEIIHRWRTQAADANTASAQSRDLRNQLAADPRAMTQKTLLSFFTSHFGNQFKILCTALGDASLSPPDGRFDKVLDTILAPLTPYARVSRLKPLLNLNFRKKLRVDAAARAAAAPPNTVADALDAASPLRAISMADLNNALRNRPAETIDAIARFDDMVAKVFSVYMHATLRVVIKHESDHASNVYSWMLGAMDAESIYQERIFYSLVRSVAIASKGIGMSAALSMDPREAVTTFYGNFDSGQYTPERMKYPDPELFIPEQTSVTGELWEELKILRQTNLADYNSRIDQIAKSLIKNPSPKTFRELHAIFSVANRHITSGDCHQLADTSYNFLSEKTQAALQNLQDFAHAIYSQINSYGSDANRYIQLLRSQNFIQGNYQAEVEGITAFLDEFRTSIIARDGVDLTKCYRDIRMFFNPDDLPVKTNSGPIRGRAFITIHSAETNQPLFTVAHKLSVITDQKTGEKTLIFVEPVSVSPANLQHMIASTQRSTGYAAFPALIGTGKDFKKHAHTLVNFSPAIAGRTLDGQTFRNLFEATVSEIASRRPINQADRTTDLNPNGGIRIFWDFTLLDKSSDAGSHPTAVKYQYASQGHHTFKFRPKRQNTNTANVQPRSPAIFQYRLLPSELTEPPVKPALIKAEYSIPDSDDLGQITTFAADVNNEPAFRGKNLSLKHTKTRILELLRATGRKVEDIVSMRQLSTSEIDYQKFMTEWSTRNALFKTKLSEINKVGMFETFMGRLMDDCDVYFSLGDISWRRYLSKTDDNIGKIVTIMHALEFRKGAVQRVDGKPYIGLVDIYNVIDINFYRFKTRASALDMLYELSSIELETNKCELISSASEDDLISKIATYCRSVRCKEIDDEAFKKSEESGRVYNKNMVMTLRKYHGFFVGHARKFGSKINLPFHIHVVDQVILQMEAESSKAVLQNDEIVESLLGVLFPMYQAHPEEIEPYFYASIKLCLDTKQFPILARFFNDKVLPVINLTKLGTDESKTTLFWSEEEIRFEYGPQNSLIKHLSFKGLISGFSPDERARFLTALEDAFALRGQKLFLEEKKDASVIYTLIPAASTQFSERFKISSKLKKNLDRMALIESTKGYVLPELDHEKSNDQTAYEYRNLQGKYSLDKLGTYAINRYLQTKAFAADDMDKLVKTFSTWLPSKEIARDYYENNAAFQSEPFSYSAADMQRDIAQMKAAVTNLPQDIRRAGHAARAAMRYLIEKYAKADTDPQRFSIIKRLVQERGKDALLYFLERTVASNFDLLDQLAAHPGGIKLQFSPFIGGASDNRHYIFAYLKKLAALPDECQFLFAALQDAFKLHNMKLQNNIDYAGNSVEVAIDNAVHQEFVDFKICDLEEFIAGLPNNTDFDIEYSSYQPSPDRQPVSVFTVGNSAANDARYKQANEILLYLNNVIPGPSVENLARALKNQLESKKRKRN
ncbi:hypothetical protein GT347_04260 [Xylophilus rhododendri]|uniref:Uncharacterized protein n=1 Tax=Xylophilus rhododendri TaxID=2697032 RepID=A0A857J2H5_9BURK|nr:hypothetical protein [Xylophilus rhododendri]QHI97261.1 hypothetical protein GT347_04260 [Xylophilus rhododendri]